MKDRVPPTRRVCPVIFVLDTSNSMEGEPIGAVNSAMENILPELESMNKDNADNEIMIAILTFNTDAKWETGGELVTPESFKRTDLNASGVTEMGKAFYALDEKLSVTQGFMKRASGSVAPVLFLLSDGEPTDDYTKGLDELQKNNWYKVAKRVAIGYGEANISVLREFTKNKETVLYTNDPLKLSELIKYVTITSTQVASKNRGIITAASEDDGSGEPADEDDGTVELAKAIKSTPELSDAVSLDDIWSK